MRIDEASLSRIWRHNEKYDCAALSAFRKTDNCSIGRKYTLQENLKRNKSLKSKLLINGYGVIAVKGVYPEGGKRVVEASYFVINEYNVKNFFKDIIRFGEFFDQDSVLLIPKGTVNGNAKAYLYGTNHCKESDPSYHKIKYFDKARFGHENEWYTTYIRNRPFVFEDVHFGERLYTPGSGFGVWMMGITSEMDWRDIEL
jgi:hypothetical protein